MKTTNLSINNSRLYALPSVALTLGVAALANAQELITNGDFSNGLTNWTQASWAGGSSFGVNSNGPTSTAAASGNYAFAGGGAYNVLQQSISGVTANNAYRLTFSAGSKSGQASTFGLLSLFDGLAGNYNSASFDYRPGDAAFGTYTVDFTARGATDVWLRNDGGGYAAYDNVSVTAIGSVANALNYSSASGFSEVTSVLSGSGKVTSNAGTGGLTLRGVNTYTGGTEVTGGTLFMAGNGTLGAANGNVTITGTGGSEVRLDLRNQQTRTGTITMTGQNARIIAGDPSNVGSLVNNGSIAFGGGQLAVAVSGTGGINVTGGGSINKANTYTGDTNISATTGWYGSNTLFVDNASALGDGSGNLTISGGIVSLQSNTVSRSGNVTISGGQLHTGTLSKSGGSFGIQGGQVDAVLAGTAGLTKSGAGNATLTGINTFTGDTSVSTGRLIVSGNGTLGATGSNITISGSGDEVILDLRNQQTRTGTITMAGQNARILSNDSTGSIVNNGGALQFGGGQLAVAVSGSGGLNVTGGGTINNANTYTGSTTISATTGWYGTNTFYVNNANALGNATADLTISGGIVSLQSNTVSRSGNVTISGGQLHTGTLNKSGGSFDMQGGQVDAVLAGTAGLTKSGAGQTALTGSNTYTGATQVNAGTLAVYHANALGSTNAGTEVADGAQLRLIGISVGNEALTISGNGAGASAGALRAGSGSNTWGGRVTLAADAKIFSGSNTSITLDVASGEAVNLGAYRLTIEGAGNHTINDAIIGTGGLTKIGSGITTLAGANTYTGNTTVSVGTLAVNGSVAGEMTVASGATLQGNGTISGATTVSGNLKPGNSPGLLTFENSLTLDSTSATTMEITGIGDRGVAYDAVDVTNALTYGGTLTLDFSGDLYTEGVYTFDLFNFGSSAGSFSSMSLAGIYSGSFTDNAGIWGLTDGDNSWSFNQGDGILTFTVVPEPNVAMVAGSLALMALLRRRRD